jgi:CheY-like chemotaxis protein
MTSKCVLYAEDDENDVFLMERAFEKISVPIPLRSVSDGKLAIAYMAGSEPYSDRQKHPLPTLVLLDLSMPGRHGHQVLQWIRSQPAYARLPVIVLTSSNQESDIYRAYLLGANGYLIKPGDPDDLLRIVSSIKQDWLGENPPTGVFADVAAMPPPLSLAEKMNPGPT